MKYEPDKNPNDKSSDNINDLEGAGHFVRVFDQSKARNYETETEEKAEKFECSSETDYDGGDRIGILIAFDEGFGVDV